METPVRNIVVLGGGPTGLTGAIYAARANLNPLVIEGSTAGGQLMLTTTIENYPGFRDGILGPDLMQAIRAQAERAGAEFVSEDAVAVDFAQRPLLVRTQSGQEVRARTVIVATGASAKMLGLPSEARFLGRGVSTCATCDGFFFRNRDVFVIGGGDTAMEEALYLANIAHSVTIVHRRHEFRASRIMQDQVLAHPRVRVMWDREVVEILGAEKVTGLRLRHGRTGEIMEQAADGVFIAIGHRPNTDLFRGQLAVNEDGYLIVDELQRTGVEGVFAAGDVHDHVYRQAITAAGYGAMAAIAANRWLQQTADRTPVPLALAS